MPKHRVPVSYDDIAPFYDGRYNAGPAGVTEILREYSQRALAGRILEVGCGTGHWLNIFTAKETLHGLDYSFGMLCRAREKSSSLLLCRGDADRLPYRASTFDFIFSVHAVQHFPDPANFIKNSFSLLRPGGMMVIIGMDPHLALDNWYVYDFFPSTRKTDLQRYPSSSLILRLMEHSGFVDCERIFSAKLHLDFVGTDVFRDPVLQKDGASQLSLLGEKEFTRGITNIRSAIARAANCGRKINFPAHITLPAVIGSVPRQGNN